MAPGENEFDNPGLVTAWFLKEWQSGQIQKRLIECLPEMCISASLDMHTGSGA